MTKVVDETAAPGRSQYTDINQAKCKAESAKNVNSVKFQLVFCPGLVFSVEMWGVSS